MVLQFPFVRVAPGNVIDVTSAASASIEHSPYRTMIRDSGDSDDVRGQRSLFFFSYLNVFSRVFTKRSSIIRYGQSSRHASHHVCEFCRGNVGDQKSPRRNDSRNSFDDAGLDTLRRYGYCDLDQPPADFRPNALLRDDTRTMGTYPDVTAFAFTLDDDYTRCVKLGN